MDMKCYIYKVDGSLPSDLPSPHVFRKTNPSNVPIYYIVIKRNKVKLGDLCD